MEVSEFIELIRRATNEFEEQLDEQGYESDDEIDVDECVEDFKIHLDALIDAEVNEPDLLKI